MSESAIVQIELAREDDVAALPDIERAAGALFAGMALPLETLATTTSVEDFADAARAGHLWVARIDDAIAGFALVELVDGQPHLEEMDVHPAHGRRGIGRRLLAAVQRWARASGLRGITLTTFRNVAWNEPFYASAGFRALSPRELSPALRAIVDEEAGRGLDPSTRVVMYWEARMLEGSCACGRVRYEIRGELLGPITYCHCWRCRKHSGSSFGTTAGVKAAEFAVVAGQELLSSWESSPGVRRFFASCCGSPIYKRGDETPGVLGFRLGTLDTDPARTGEVHFMVGSKAPWVEIRDGLPQTAGGVRFGERD